LKGKILDPLFPPKRYKVGSLCDFFLKGGVRFRFLAAPQCMSRPPSDISAGSCSWPRRKKRDPKASTHDHQVVWSYQKLPSFFSPQQKICPQRSPLVASPTKHNTWGTMRHLTRIPLQSPEQLCLSWLVSHKRVTPCVTLLLTPHVWNFPYNTTVSPLNFLANV